MKKFLKVFFIIIAIIIVLLTIHTIRNFMIITKLQNNSKPYLSSTNYHLTVSSQSNISTMTTNYYIKDGRQAVIQERSNKGVTAKISMYNNGERIVSYYDTPADKIVKLNTPSLISVNLASYFTYMCDSTMQKISMSFMLKIQNTEYNGKPCYIVSPLISSENNIEYIEKDTGLTIKSIFAEETVEKEYEFDNVIDEIFTEPDISQYRVEEDN